ncbi:hypothetical protein PENARI_c019G00605 [Penicillium arizonense]|uniref:MARVEL domain-containing protein n=1 Tax=Penicillium arizonense TaxID=1835702 RepID=A0A1F5L9M4_PENAI|nr:hypothetical protein PENARI_c019G00605 [Penicillium arizonense]OGE49905.1 hypothetical protein PENARI_c019G00605 [Penicillium arizonense]
MLALNIVLYALLGTSLAFAIVELGLSAFLTSAYTGTREVATWSAYSGYSYTTVNVKAPAILAFLVFSACWTILVTAAALVLPWHFAKKGFVTAKLNTILASCFVGVYSITMVFWLACFADLASLLGGGTSDSPYFNAILAFGVLLWLLFVALVVFTVLAMCGVMASDWAGYQSLRKDKGVEGAQTSGHAHDVPMSTTPVVPEMSARDAEGLHNQPSSQSHSISSPSAVHSAELNGDSVHDNNTGRTAQISPV